MRIQFTRSARRHRIGKAHALFVMETVEPTDEGTDANGYPLLRWEGDDDRGLTLVILAAVVDAGETLLVFHVQPTYGRGQ